MNRVALIPQKFFDGEVWVENQAIVIEDGRIHSFLPKDKLAPELEITQMPEYALAPAFVDIQIYGGHEKFLSLHPSIETLHAISDYCREGGAALFLPTIATNTLPTIYKSIDAIRAYWKEGGKGVYGLHLEGPWISKEKKGAHIEELIHSPTIDEVKTVLSYGKDVIKLITVAPEVCSDEVLYLLQTEGIIISAGHSNASYEEAVNGFSKGISTVTHFYNAMSSLKHRSPGLIGATFMHKSVTASIIPDGHHVRFEALAIAKKIMGPRLFAITDAVTATSDSLYSHQLDGDVYKRDGILSGSALTMSKAFYNLINEVHLEIEEALRMCSLYPAQTLKADDAYGKIARGYVAEFVILNRKFEVQGLV